MRHFLMPAIAVAGFAAVADRPTRADEVPMGGFVQLAAEPSPDSPLGRSWWLPGNTSHDGPGADLDEFFGGGRGAPGTQQRSLIEQAQSLLDTPRFERRRGAHSVGDVDGALPLPCPSGDQFSRAWSDGAPLLLFDWTGKSREPSTIPNLGQDGLKRVASAKTATDWADLSSKVKLRQRDPNLDPGVANAWETDESVKLPVAGSLFVFGQLGASTPAVEQRQYKWLGKTGVGMKLKPWLLQEVQVRGGPAVRYDDTEKLSPGQSPERSELFLEAVTKLPLPGLGPVNVEYTSYAVPAPTSADRNCVNQDVKVALPFTGGGQFHVGASYKWETASATPWMDRMGVYLGVQSKW